MKKKLFGLLFTFIFVVSSLMPKVAAYDATIVLQKAYFSNTTKRQTNIASSVFKWAVTSNGLVPVYCLNAGKEAPSHGAVLSIANDITSAPLVFALTHGYQPDGSYDASIMGAGLDPETAYYATALAVWLLEGAYTPSQLDTNIPACVAAINLYNVARTQTTTDVGAIWSSMAAETYELHLSSDGTRYETVDMWLVGNTNVIKSATVVIESPVSYTLTRGNGSTFSSGTTLNYGEHWKLSVPKDSVSGEINIKVKWSTSYSVPRVYRYVSNETDKQELGVIMTETLPIEDYATLHVTPTRTPNCSDELTTLFSKYPKSERKESNSSYMSELKALNSKYAPSFDMEDIDEPSCTPKQRTCQTKLDKLLNLTPAELRVSTNTSYVNSLKKLASEYETFDMDDLTNPSCNPVACQTKLDRLLARTPESKRNKENSEYYEELKRLASSYSTFDMDDLKNPSCTPVKKTCEAKLKAILDKTPASERTSSNTSYVNSLKELEKEYTNFDMSNLASPSCTPVSKSCQEDLDKIFAKYSKEERNEYNAEYINALNEFKGKHQEADILDPSNPSCTPRYEKILRIRKVDAKTGADVAGATLQLQKADGTFIDQWVTDGSAKVFTNLEAGDYVLVELQAPEGYELGEDVISFTLVGNDYSVDIEMKNSPIPDTADMNFTLMMTSFIVFLGFGIFGLVKAGRREA